MSLRTPASVTALVLLVLGLSGPPPAAADASVIRDCRELPQISPGIHRQTFASTEVTGGVAGIPDRVNADVEPGGSERLCVGFQNRTGGDITFRFEAQDVGASRTGAPSSGEPSKYGAAKWFTLPAPPRATLEHGDLVWLDIRIDVPADTSGGSNYAAIKAVPVDTAASDAVQTRILPALAVQVFLDTPGDVDRSGKVTGVRAPRVIWWDGLDIADIGILKRLRGPGIAPIRFKWRNTGSFTERVGGRIRIESDLGGKDVTTLPLKDTVVLRDSERALEETWSDDIPIVGRFTPTIEIAGPDGRVSKTELPAIWVIPSWWYLLALALAIAIPVTNRRRSRRRYRELVERVEAAEGRAPLHDADPGDWHH